MSDRRGLGGPKSVYRGKVHNVASRLTDIGYRCLERGRATCGMSESDYIEKALRLLYLSEGGDDGQDKASQDPAGDSDRS